MAVSMAVTAVHWIAHHDVQNETFVVVVVDQQVVQVHTLVHMHHGSPPPLLTGTDWNTGSLVVHHSHSQ